MVLGNCSRWPCWSKVRLHDLQSSLPRPWVTVFAVQENKLDCKGQEAFKIQEPLALLLYTDVLPSVTREQARKTQDQQQNHGNVWWNWPLSPQHPAR